MDFPEILTRWYSESKRDFPFRKTKDPYIIWVSEVIFQQTRIEQGVAYFNRFIKRFPDVQKLAKADENEVLKFWEGLGYYSRARNLHFSAKFIVNELQGKFPDSYEELLNLKGVGDYTAGAIASISYNLPYLAIDGNALRVYSRLLNSFLNIAETSTLKTYKERINPFIPENSGEFNQAIMELGATICIPRNPKCDDCPISEKCLAFKNNTQKELPIKKKKLKIQNKSLNYYFYYFENQVLIRQRTKQGIWKGLFELMSQSIEDVETQKETFVKHKLTHRNLNIQFYSGELNKIEFQKNQNLKDSVWVKFDDLEKYAFPKPIKDFIFTFVGNTTIEKNQIL